MINTDMYQYKNHYWCQICNIWLKIGPTERGQKREISVARKRLWGLMGNFPQRQGGTLVESKLFCFCTNVPSGDMFFFPALGRKTVELGEEVFSINIYEMNILLNNLTPHLVRPTSTTNTVPNLKFKSSVKLFKSSKPFFSY